MEDEKSTNKTSKNLKILAVVLIVVGLGIAVYLVYASSISGARDDDASLSQINSLSKKNTVVLYFWGSGCGACNEQKPIIEDLEQDYKAENVTFYWFDSSRHNDLTEHYDIYGVPTIIVLNKNGVVEKFVGYTEYVSISDMIEKAKLAYE